MNQVERVYVVSKSGKPLMPTKRLGKVRRLLKSGKAKVCKIVTRLRFSCYMKRLNIHKRLLLALMLAIKRLAFQRPQRKKN